MIEYFLEKGCSTTQERRILTLGLRLAECLALVSPGKAGHFPAPEPYFFDMKIMFCTQVSCLHSGGRGISERRRLQMQMHNEGSILH